MARGGEQAAPRPLPCTHTSAARGQAASPRARVERESQLLVLHGNVDRCGRGWTAVPRGLAQVHGGVCAPLGCRPPCSPRGYGCPQRVSVKHGRARAPELYSQGIRFKRHLSIGAGASPRGSCVWSVSARLYAAVPWRRRRLLPGVGPNNFWLGAMLERSRSAPVATACAHRICALDHALQALNWALADTRRRPAWPRWQRDGGEHNRRRRVDVPYLCWV